MVRMMQRTSSLYNLLRAEDNDGVDRLTLGTTNRKTNAATKWLQIKDSDQIMDLDIFLDLVTCYIGIDENHTDQIDLVKKPDLAFFVQIDFDLHSD